MKKHVKAATMVRIAVIGAALWMAGCGGGTEEKKPATAPEATPPAAEVKPEKGKMITDEQITLGAVDQGMVAKGKSTYEVKCLSCHSLGENRIVGPGWKGITNRRPTTWIMNMIMNTEMMLETDPEAQKTLEECLVRMPNQNLTFDEARQVLEFMRTL
jgi:cytochrome c1